MRAKGFQSFSFSTGSTKTITGPATQSDKIDYQKMEKVTRTIYMMLWEIASRPARPKVDKPLPAQLWEAGREKSVGYQ